MIPTFLVVKLRLSDQLKKLQI